MSGRIVSINCSNGGVPKQPVSECRVTESGLEGDRQRHLDFHGGPNRAVTLFSLERIEELQREGHPIAPGTIGENLTVSGLDWSHMKPEAQLQVGEVVLQLTKFAAPCANIAGSFREGDFYRVSERRHAGWSRLCARVVTGGLIRVGDSVRLFPMPERAEALLAPLPERERGRGEG